MGVLAEIGAAPYAFHVKRWPGFSVSRSQPSSISFCMPITTAANNSMSDHFYQQGCPVDN